jgi:hypothetical protein
MLLLSSIDDYVGLNNSVRAIDAYVGTLDLLDLGFKNTQLDGHLTSQQYC